jgi:hypothetical protein
MASPLTLVITLLEEPTATAPAGRLGCMSADLDKSSEAYKLLHADFHAASNGILQALAEGRGWSQAAKVLDGMDRVALRELGFDSVVLMVKL